jgi:hypothetical protein
VRASRPSPSRAWRRTRACGRRRSTRTSTGSTTCAAGSRIAAGVAAAQRDYARRHPGSYLAAQRAPDRDDPEALAAAAEAVEVLVAVLSGYELAGDDAIHAARAVRSALHGFVLLETGGGFGIKLDLDESFDRLVALLDHGLRS